ncbi:MAG TPA: energy transducer TonB, partial [Luteimonas sp.]|nr:energy transducer TonB [Luteimonas sp.]
MSAAALPRPPIGEKERLRATLVLSALLHGMLLLGVGFALKDAAPVLPTLDVILTSTSSPLTPKQADFLAQANNQGGGQSNKALRPTETEIGESIRPDSGIAPRELRAQSPAPQPPPQARVISSVRGDVAAPQAEATPKLDPVPLPPGRLKVEHDMEM